MSTKTTFITALLCVSIFSVTSGQISTITTESGQNYNTTLGTSGPGGITFAIENTNTAPIIVVGLDVFLTFSSHRTTLTLVMNDSILSGPPNINHSSWKTIREEKNVLSTSSGYKKAFKNLAVTIPPQTTYRFAVLSTIGIAYVTPGSPSPASFQVGGVNLHNGSYKINNQDVGYGGNYPALNLNPRFFTGRVHFMTLSPCSTPPSMIKVLSTDTLVCQGSPTWLMLDSFPHALGQSFQWQSSSNNITWSNLANDTMPNLRTTPNSDTYYRCIVTCGTSVPSQSIFIKIKPGSLNGTYTLNKNLPLGSGNFQSFNQLADVLHCSGVSGPVVINVAANSGPHEERVEFGQIAGAGSLNTITINGNGDTLVYLPTFEREQATLSLKGATHFVFNNLVIKSEGTNFGATVQFWHQADSNTFNQCSFISESSNSDVHNVVMNSTATIISLGTGNNGNYNSFNVCRFIGGHYGLSMLGDPINGCIGNHVQNCTFEKSRVSGVFFRNQHFGSLVGNRFTDMTTGDPLPKRVVQGEGACLGFVISKNVIHDIKSWGSTVPASIFGVYLNTVSGTSQHPVVVKNNIIHSFFSTNNKHGIYIHSNGSYIDVFHNTIAIDYSSPLSTGHASGVYIGGGSSNISVKNNILHMNVYGGSSNVRKTPINIQSSNNIVSNYNVLHNPRTGNNNPIGVRNIYNYGTLLSWQGQGFDQNSLDVDSKFNNVYNDTLVPKANALIDLADSLGVTEDFFGFPRSLSQPQVGALEFVPIISNLTLSSLEISKGLCPNSDSLHIKIWNTHSSSVDFSIDTLVIDWHVDGPLNNSSVFVVNSGILVAGDSLQISIPINLSLSGVYVALAELRPNAFNQVFYTNKAISDSTIVLQQSIYKASPDTIVVNDTSGTVEMYVTSSSLPAAKHPIITEICQDRNSTNGMPAFGWPPYLTANNYIEITGPPSMDLGGVSLELWSGSGIVSSHTFPFGTLLSPDGTAIIATGNYTGQPSFQDFYYFISTNSNTTATTARGYILRDAQTNNIIDAVVYGNMLFPFASGVTPSIWTGNTQIANSTGIRLEGSYSRSQTNWTNAGSSGANNGQSPNIRNITNFQDDITAPGFMWELDGVFVDSMRTTQQGPFAPGTYTLKYVAKHNGQCGLLSDTVYVFVDIPIDPQFELMFPTDGSLIDVNGPAGQLIEFVWTPSAMPNPNYTVLVRSINGGYASPLITNPSNNSGNDTVLSLTIWEVDSILDHLGVAIGNTLDVFWNVRMISNSDTTFANEEFSLSLKRGAITDIGILEKLQNTILVYPNPTDGLLHIKSPQAWQTAEVTDLAGRTLLTAKEPYRPLDLAKLPSGVYFVKVYFENVVVVKKVVRE